MALPTAESIHFVLSCHLYPEWGAKFYLAVLSNSPPAPPFPPPHPPAAWGCGPKGSTLLKSTFPLILWFFDFPLIWLTKPDLTCLCDASSHPCLLAFSSISWWTSNFSNFATPHCSSLCTLPSVIVAWWPQLISATVNQSVIYTLSWDYVYAWLM